MFKKLRKAVRNTQKVANETKTHVVKEADAISRFVETQSQLSRSSSLADKTLQDVVLKALNSSEEMMTSMKGILKIAEEHRRVERIERDKKRQRDEAAAEARKVKAKVDSLKKREGLPQLDCRCEAAGGRRGALLLAEEELEGNVAACHLHAVTDRRVLPIHTAALHRPAFPLTLLCFGLPRNRGARPHCEAHAGEVVHVAALPFARRRKEGITIDELHYRRRISSSESLRVLHVAAAVETAIEELLSAHSSSESFVDCCRVEREKLTPEYGLLVTIACRV
nr:hypothetical protein Iba_scaffold8447CG0030 [Ipomoea batatas]